MDNQEVVIQFDDVKLGNIKYDAEILVRLILPPYVKTTIQLQSNRKIYNAIICELLKLFESYKSIDLLMPARNQGLSNSIFDIFEKYKKLEAIGDIMYLIQYIFVVLNSDPIQGVPVNTNMGIYYLQGTNQFLYKKFFTKDFDIINYVCKFFRNSFDITVGYAKEGNPYYSGSGSTLKLKISIL